MNLEQKGEELERSAFIDEKEVAQKVSVQKLEELCKPVADYLKSNLNPHCTVIITDRHIRLIRDEIGIPVKSDD